MGHRIMRTWKQGRIGKIAQPDGAILYVKCLRYPLARFYGTFDIDTGVLGDFCFEEHIELSSFPLIETIGQQNLTGEEKARGNGLEHHRMTNTPI